MTFSTLKTETGSNRIIWSILKGLPSLGCSLLLLAYTLFFVYRALTALFYPYPLDASENPLLNSASHLLQASLSPPSLYPNNVAAPYRLENFGPVFYYLNALLMLIFGAHQMLAGRLVGLGATLFLVFLGFRVARREEISAGRKTGIGVSLAAALTPLATLVFWGWGVLARPDTLALVFSVLAVERVWLATAESERRRQTTARPFVVAGLLVALALLTYQTALVAPLAITFWLASQRRWRDLGYFLATLVGTLGVVGLGLQLAGSHFWRHWIVYNLSGWDFGRLLDGLSYFWLGHLVLLGLALVWTVRPLIGRFERIDLWRIYFLTALVSGIGAGWLAGTNFWLESLWLTSLLAWLELGRLQARRPTARLGDWRPEIGPFVLVLVVFQLLWLHHVPLIDDPNHTAAATDQEQVNNVVTILQERQSAGPILAESSGWLSLAGLPVELDAPLGFGQLAAQGQWNEQPFLERLRAGYYKTVVFELVLPGNPINLTTQDRILDSNAPFSYPAHFSSATLAVLQDRTKFAPYKRVGRFLFLAWKG